MGGEPEERRPPQGGEGAPRPRLPAWPLVPLGAVIAAWSSMCGIGGGLFAVPVLHYVYRTPLKEAVATALGLVAASTLFGTLSELFHADSALRWEVLVALVLGSLVGTRLGFRAAQRVDVRRLKQLFALLQPLVGLQLLLMGRPEAAVSAAASELSAGHYALAVAIGAGAGFVAPLLGIGGGLVAVPGLYFGLPSLGYLGARANSLALAVFNSFRSLGLYAKTGRVHVPRALLFGAGAAFGAVVGVRLVHLPGVGDVARRMMGFTLLLVGARFALDLRRAPSDQAPSDQAPSDQAPSDQAPSDQA